MCIRDSILAALPKKNGEGTVYNNTICISIGITVQGVGSQVPAAVMGVRAGPGLLLSNERNVTGVSHYFPLTNSAPSKTKGTVNATYGNPFWRSSLLQTITWRQS